MNEMYRRYFEEIRRRMEQLRLEDLLPVHGLMIEDGELSALRTSRFLTLYNRPLSYQEFLSEGDIVEWRISTGRKLKLESDNYHVVGQVAAIAYGPGNAGDILIRYLRDFREDELGLAKTQ